MCAHCSAKNALCQHIYITKDYKLESYPFMKDLTEAERRTLYRMPHSVRATFLLWRIGINPKYTIAAETYRRHRALLAEKFGVDITALP